MSTHANRVKMTVTSVASTGLGAITLNAASTGFRSFATAYSNANATVDILITEGTAWEIARNCTYTHSGTTVSRGTLESSSTGSAVVFTSAAVVSVIATAAFGNAVEKQLDRVITTVTTDGSTALTVTAAQANKITNINTVVSNPSSWWDNTNKKFTPLRAGKYVLSAGSQLVQSAQHTVSIYKNGSQTLTGANFAPPSGGYGVSTVIGIIEANGSTDYFEVYAFSGTGGTTVYENNGFFQAYFLSE
jgi:hypothetical protein